MPNAMEGGKSVTRIRNKILGNQKQANLLEKNEKKTEHQKIPLVVDREEECSEDSYPQ